MLFIHCSTSCMHNASTRSSNGTHFQTNKQHTHQKLFTKCKRKSPVFSFLFVTPYIIFVYFVLYLSVFLHAYPPIVCWLNPLSMNVSNINSLATVTWEDFLSTQKRFKGYEDKKQLSAIKHLAIIYAVVIMGIAYCVGFLSGVIEGAMLANSATTGPLVGVFILAMLIPCANGKVCCIYFLRYPCANRKDF